MIRRILLLMAVSVLLLSAFGQAESIILTLDQTNFTFTPGEWVSLTGTLTNNTSHHLTLYLPCIQAENRELLWIEYGADLQMDAEIDAGQSITGELLRFTALSEGSLYGRTFFPFIADGCGPFGNCDSFNIMFADEIPVTIHSSAASPVPEPASLMLLGSGILGAAGVIRRKLFA